MKIFWLSFLMLTVILGISCTSNNTVSNNDSIQNSEKDTVKAIDSISIVDGGIPIFYNMYLSVEMSSMFKTIGAAFDDKVINSPEKTNQYETSTDKALNLGVYAVDLSYCKFFDQFNIAGKYLKNMQKLSEELGIPSDKFFISVKRIEANLTNKDSLIKIANEIYKTTEEYLNKNDRGSAAAIIIVGGWVEAMYIATDLIKKDTKDIELFERIAEQKQSVKDLLELLSNFKKEPLIKDLIIKLTDIKEALDKTVIDEKDFQKTFALVSDLKVKISSMRKSIVN